MPARPSPHLPLPALLRLGVALLLAAQLVPAPARAAAPAGPAADHAPVAHDDNLVAFADQDFQRLYPLDNDTDADGDPLTIYSITPPQHGDFFRNATTIDYKPFNGFSGIDIFKYTAQDPAGMKSTATITVTVEPPGASGTASNRFAVSACDPNTDSCDTSLWTVSPYSGASSVTGACTGGAGLGVDDAELLLSDRVNAFDTGLTLWINGQQFQPALPMTVTHYSLVSGPVSMANVRVIVHYDGLIGSDTLRTQVVLGNPTGTAKSLTATLASNLGSNGHTTIIGTSDGNTSFTKTDRWLVTSNSASNPGGIVSTNVLFGPGAPQVTPSAVYTSTFTCGENPPSNEGVRADFAVSVPAHATRRLLFFTQAHDSNAGALSAASAFDGEPVGMLAGLTNGQLAQVLNWDLGPISALYLPFVRR